jgi:hypothetical protein
MPQKTSAKSRKRTTKKSTVRTGRNSVTGWPAARIKLTALAFVVLFGFIGAWQLQRSHADTSTNINTADKAQVNSYYNLLWKSGLGVTSGWNGSIGSCIPGTSSEAAHTAMIRAINLARRLNGLTPINGAYSPNANQNIAAQTAALYQDANQPIDSNSAAKPAYVLNHYPPTSWNCSRKIGSLGGDTSSKSLLALSTPVMTPLLAIKDFLNDPGVGNEPVGHRRWLLNPDAINFGFGISKRVAAVKVVGVKLDTTNNDPAWTQWPSKGYFPNTIEPHGRWSVSGHAGYCFNRATVGVMHNGAAVQVTLLDRSDRDYARPTIAWQMPAGIDLTGSYTVTISNVNKWTSSGCSTATSTRIGGTYTVSLFTPY